MSPFDPAELPIAALAGDDVAHVAPSATLVEVAELMTAQGISALGVGSDTELVGVVTERDVVRAVGARCDPAVTTAGDVAVTNLVWTDPDATIAEVANEMMDQWIRHVLVGAPGQLMGIVSIRDVLGAYAAADVDPLG